MKKRILAILLCLVLVVGSQGISTLAFTVRDEAGNIVPTAGENSERPVIRTQDGDIEYEESWEELYPYGTFAFGNYQADVAEGGPIEPDGLRVPSKIVMPVYRVGGTTGKVTAKIVYTPAVAESDEDGTLNYDFAASGTKDMRISYENPLSIAASQPIGRAPVFGDTLGHVTVYPKNEEEIWKLNEYPYTIVEWVLSANNLGVTGSEVNYKWQIGSDFETVNGITYATTWTDIFDSNTLSIELTNTDIWDIETMSWKNDYRLIYSVDGVLYSPKSLMNTFSDDITVIEQAAVNEEIPVEETAPVAQPEQSAVEEIHIEETVVEESAVEEPAVEESVVEESAVEEAVAEETGAEETGAEEIETEVEEPVVEETAVEEPAVEETSAEETPVAEIYVAEVPDEEITYTTIDFGEEFDAYEFEITFAENEWVKNIIIEAVDDDVRELNELGLFTITGCVGGEISSICNTCTVMVSDNEAKAASEIGFEVTDVYCDQDDGYAELVIRRTGDTTYNVTVDYTTCNMTAEAGKQYTETSGTATLVGSIDEFTVKVPLIAEKARTEELEFSVCLSNITGGLDGLCKLDVDKNLAIIHLSSTGDLWDSESGLNLSSILSRADADEVAGNVYFEDGSLVPDASKVSTNSFDNNSEDLQGVYEKPGADTQTYTYAKAVTFSRGDAQNFWRDREVVVGNTGSYGDASSAMSYITTMSLVQPVFNTSQKAPNDGSYNTKFYAGQDKISMTHYAGTESTQPLSFSINDAARLFSKVDYSFKVARTAVARAGISKEDNFRYILPVTNVWQQTDSGSSSPVAKSDHRIIVHKSGSSPEMERPAGASSTFAGTYTLNPNTTKTKWFASVEFWVATNKETTDHPKETANAHAVYELNYLYLTRRVFNQTGINVRVYTANDSDTRNSYSAGDKSKFALLDTTSSVYESIKPDISIVSKAGGVNSKGQIYVGTKLKVTVKNTVDYFLAQGTDSAADYAVFVTDSNGNKVPVKVEKDSSDAKVFYITLSWDKMTDAELARNLCINVVMTRRQSININIDNSIVRNENGTVTTEATKQAWNKFAEKNGSSKVLTYGYAKESNTVGVRFTYASSGSKNWNTLVKNKDTASVVLTDLSGITDENIMWINFGQDPDDIISFNGKEYAGNETIYLTMQELAFDNLTFFFIDEDCLENTVPMSASIDHIEMYFDGNGNGKIDGSLDAVTGYFTPDSGDLLISRNVTESFADNEYRPIVSNGKVYQYFFKVFYSTNPRSFRRPAAEKDFPGKAVVLPFFTSGTTEPTIREQQTKEQKGYRYIEASELHEQAVYGAEATSVTSMDLPLGGDSAQIIAKKTETGKADKNFNTIDSDSSTVYEWNPEYHGNLMFAYDDPEYVSFEQNITKTPIALTDKDAINDYLGAFADNTILGLAVYRGNLNTFKNAGGNEKPETYTLGEIKAVRASLSALQTEGNKNNKQSGETSQPEEVNTYPEYSADLGIQLPSLEFEMGDYFNISLDGYSLAISIGIPVYSKEDETYSGKKQDIDSQGADLIEGAKTCSYSSSQDEAGNDIETKHYYDENGKEIGTTTTVLEKTTTVPGENGTSVSNTTTTTTMTPADGSGDQTKTCKVMEIKDSNGEVIQRVVVNNTYYPDGTRKYSETTYNRNAEGGFDMVGHNEEQAKVSGVPAPTTAATATPTGSEKKNTARENFLAANEGLKAVGQFFTGIASKLKGGNQSTGLKDLLTSDDSLKQAKGANPKSTCKSFELSVSLQLALAFEYNPIDDEWFFKQAGLSASLGIEFTIKYRLTPCPIVYVYVKFGVEIEVALGLSVDRVAVRDAKILTNMSTNPGVGTISFEMLIDKDKDGGGRGFSAKFDGTILMDVVKNKGEANEETLIHGIIKGDGETATDVFFQNYGEKVTITLTCLYGLSTEDVTELKGIKGAKSEVHFDGVSVNPTFSIEAGAGVGVECFNIEICIRVNLSIEFVFGGYVAELNDGKGGYKGAYMSAFDFSLSLGINVTFLFFHFEMDAIGVKIHGEQDPTNAKHSTWTTTVFALNDWVDPLYEHSKDYYLSLNDDEDVSSDGMIHESGPSDVSGTVKIAGIGSGNGAETLAYNPTDNNSPFQLSGYNTGSDGKKLISGLTSGYTYKLFTVGDDNYILYPLSDTVNVSGSSVTITRLALSKLVLEADSANGGTMTGLQNPVDADSSSAYVFVDNDDMADLEFNVGVEGSKATVVWTGYDKTENFTSATEAAGNLEVKRSTIDFGDAVPAFATPQVTSSAAVYRTLPVQTGDHTIYVEAADSDGTQANAEFKKYLTAKFGLTEEEFESRNTTEASHVSALYNWITKSELNKANGTHSNIVIQGSSGDPVRFDVRGTGSTALETVENLEAVTMSNGNVLVAYTTSETEYFDTEGLTVGLEGIDETTEQGIIRRLYLKEFDTSTSTWKTSKLIHTVIDFETCNFDNFDRCLLKDGLYVEGVYQDKVKMADPIFSNLKFVNAKLDGVNSETVFLYEMGGNTNIIDEENWSNAISGGICEAKNVFSETTGTNVNISSDADGAMALVYTAPVKGTSNNALFVAYWDDVLGGFGSANMLAMNHMQVYEDANALDLSDEDLEKAFLGLNTGDSEYEELKRNYTDDRNLGAMDTFTFGNIQMTTRANINPETNESAKQLVVLTEGTMIQLKPQEFKYSETRNGKSVSCSSIVYVKDTSKAADVGFYAIAFGNGEQAVSNGKIEFQYNSFGAGDVLSGVVEFMNTGTTSIRGSEMSPITVELVAYGEGTSQVLAKGYIHENIVAGGKGEMKFVTDELSQTLATGTKFKVIVSEDDAYITATGGTAFNGTIDNLFTVAAKPELSFGEYSFDVVGIDETAQKAVIDFNAYVRNTGNTEAEHVFVQIAYDSGETDANGISIYKPIDLTGSNIETTTQQAIQLYGLNVTENNLQRGIVALKNSKDGQNIKPGYERIVRGTLRVPLSCFTSTEQTSGLHLKAEIFSDADEAKYDLSSNNYMYASDHLGEYNGMNNVILHTINHKTVFDAAAQISLALGNTVYIPVTSASTYPDGDIVVKEVKEEANDWKQLLGILYYDTNTRTIVAVPSKNSEDLIKANRIPEGTIEIQDRNTNSQYPIAFKVTQQDLGVNIFHDDASFVFKNANGSIVDPASAQVNRDWRFNSKNTNWQVYGDSTSIVPMNGDLCVAEKVGAKVSFDTVASDIKIIYSGKIKVSSSLSGSSSTFESNRAGSETSVINYNNNSGLTHTITIEALTVGTSIDRYVAHYSSNSNAIPAVDGNAPAVYYSRSFPDTASIDPSTMAGGLVFKAYVLDENGIADVTADGGIIDSIDKSADGTMWTVTVRIKQNSSSGTYNFKATDKSGNGTVSRIPAMWFSSIVTPDTVSSAPSIDESKIVVVDEKGNAVAANAIMSKAPYLKYTGNVGTDETVAVKSSMLGYFTGADIATSSALTWQMTNNGYYLVQLKNTQNNTWAQVVKQANYLKSGEPQLEARLTTGQDSISIAADVPDGIGELTINGYVVSEATGLKKYSMVYKPMLGGEYTVVVKDKAGTSVSQTVTVSNKILVDDDGVVVRPDGTIFISGTAVSGGSYDPDRKSNGMNPEQYSTAYYAAVTEVTSAGAIEVDDSKFVELTAAGITVDNRHASKYALVVRDYSMDEALQKVVVIDVKVKLNVDESKIHVDSDAVLHIDDGAVSGGYYKATDTTGDVSVDATGYNLPYSVMITEITSGSAVDMSVAEADKFTQMSASGIAYQAVHAVPHGIIFRVDSDEESGQIAASCDSFYAITYSSGEGYTINPSTPNIVGPGGRFEFKFVKDGDYSDTKVSIYANGELLELNNNRTFSVENINGNVNIVVTGMYKPLYFAVYDKPDNDIDLEDTKTPESIELRVGASFKSTEVNGNFKVTSTGSAITSGTVAYMGPVTKVEKELMVPDSVEVNGVTYNVTSIGEGAFRNNVLIETITMEAGIKTIEKNAFRNCDNLTTVVIGKGVTTIGASAFLGCDNLKTVTIGNKVTSIGSYAFYKCKSLTEITIPASVKAIEAKAFASCTKLKKIVIKSTKLKAANIGIKAFNNINKSAVFTVPKKKEKAYTSIIRDVISSKKIKIVAE